MSSRSETVCFYVKLHVVLWHLYWCHGVKPAPTQPSFKDDFFLFHSNHNLFIKLPKGFQALNHRLYIKDEIMVSTICFGFHILKAQHSSFHAAILVFEA